VGPFHHRSDSCAMEQTGWPWWMQVSAVGGAPGGGDIGGWQVNMEGGGGVSVPGSRRGHIDTRRWVSLAQPGRGSWGEGIVSYQVDVSVWECAVPGSRRVTFMEAGD
jgi:hypothetical protein